MTRDELREQIATLVATLSITEATDHILALIPPQPKLEWRDTGLRGDFEELCLGGLVVGFTAIVRDMASIMLHGKFAWLNFPDEMAAAAKSIGALDEVAKAVGGK